MPETHEFIDVVFDGPPAHESHPKRWLGIGGRFVEVEDPRGQGISVGEWIDRGNGLWVLRIPMQISTKQAELLKAVRSLIDSLPDVALYWAEPNVVNSHVIKHWRDRVKGLLA